MDRFFSQKACDRCGGDLAGGRIMSMYSTACLCMACKAAETKRPDYRAAADAELAEVKRGNYNYPGIEGRGAKC
jgi:hypothetical protein